MATSTQGGAPATPTTTTEASLLDQAITATRQTEPEQAQLLLKTLTEEALKGTVTFSRNLTVTFNKAVELLDKKLSEQVAAILHHPDFLKLEGSWRGLDYLVSNTITDSQLKIKMLNVSKTEVAKDLAKATDFDQSDTFKRIYTSEFGTLGGEPFGALIGDYEFTNHPTDVEFLTSMSSIAAASFCPFISATNSKMFGLETFSDLSKPKDLQKNFESMEYQRWRSFRDRDESAFVTLTMPRVLARVPYGSSTKPIEEFAFEEAPKDSKGAEKPMKHEEYCWMNASFVLGARLTDSFAQNGWCTAIRGVESGGLVESLPVHAFPSDDGGVDMKCPTEIAISDRREAELANAGLMPLVHRKGTDMAAFIGAQSLQKPMEYMDLDATANARLAARLPYMFATCRFAHYLKCMVRDKIGSFKERAEMERFLGNWIMQYTLGNPGVAGEEQKARRPLAGASVKVEEVEGNPGYYTAQFLLRPHYQLEGVNVTLSLVSRLPSATNS